MKLIANISTLFTELPFCERIYAAADAGFEGVEIQFPYGENLSEIQNACSRSGMNAELINLPAGDWGAGDVGLAALPDRTEEFQQSMELALGWANELGVKKVNVLSGRAENSSQETLFETLAANLARAADNFARINVQVELEVINALDVPGFYAGSLEVGLAVLKNLNHSNLKLQFDFYHMARLGHDLVEAIQRSDGLIGHVQFADNPGRHEPGSGNIDFATAIGALKVAGYGGAVSAEYFPSAKTAYSLEWMDNFKGMME